MKTKQYLGLHIDGTYHQYEAWKKGEEYYVSPYGKTQWGESDDDVFGPYSKEQFESNYYVSEYEWPMDPLTRKIKSAERMQKDAIAIVIVAMLALASLTGVFVWIGVQSFQIADNVHLQD